MMIQMIPTLRTLDSSSTGDKPFQLTLNLATQSSVLLNLLHRRRMRGSLTVSTGNRPTGRSFTCLGKQHRQRQGKHGLPTRYTRTARYVVKLLSSQKNKPIFQDAYWYTEMLSIISIDFVKSFGQHGVNNQLVTAPVLRRRLSLSSRTFAFHYISQHLETQQHQHRPSSFSPHHHSLAYTSPLLEVNTPRQVMERITCSPIILLKHLASGQIIKKMYSVLELLEQQTTFVRLT